MNIDISVLEKLDQYERILRQHDLLPPKPEGVHGPPMSAAQVPLKEEPRGAALITEPVSRNWHIPIDVSPEGKLFVGKGGQPRYTDSILWRKLRDQFEDDLQLTSDDEEEYDGEDATEHEKPPFDPFPGAFLNMASSHQSLLRHHPSQEEAMILWKIYCENVEPIARILHVPSASRMVETLSKNPVASSRAQEALLFAIYHFAVFSMSEEECVERFGPQQSRTVLIRRYQFATQLALVNASFLKTTDMTVLQALLLFLASSIYSYDSHTFWILTGVAVRIGQRIGLHRDGEKLGLPPFEVQMRRRIFCQLLPLDGLASHMSGITGISAIPEGWDTLQPLNVNDDQIWPGMTETPTEQKCPTDMIFFLSRLCSAKLIAKASKVEDEKAGHLLTSQAKSEVEEAFIRHCDVVNPLHFITASMARAGLTAMQLRVKLPKVRNNTATDAERRELFQLAMKILETDIATHMQGDFLKRYRWHIQPFYLWGSWDSLIVVLSTLWRSGHLRNDLLTPAETDDAWKKLEQIYHHHHGELIESKRALHVTFGRLTLRAWDVRPPVGEGVPEPSFITALRGRAERRQVGHATGTPTPSNPLPSEGNTLQFEMQTLDDLGIDWAAEGISFDANAADLDWMFWDQVVQGG